LPVEFRMATFVPARPVRRYSLFLSCLTIIQSIGIDWPWSRTPACGGDTRKTGPMKPSTPAHECSKLNRSRDGGAPARFTAAATHLHLVAAARRPLPRLADALAGLGPVWFPPRPRNGGPAWVLARAVVGQQLSAAAAATIWRRVQEAAGSGHAATLAFFQPGRLDELRACGVSGAKARTLLAIGSLCRSGQLEHTLMKKLGPEARREVLLALPGVGPWTCDMLEIFYFRSPDIWPTGDAAAMGMYRTFLGDGKRAGALLADAGPFRPYRSLLSLALWRMVSARTGR